MADEISFDSHAEAACRADLRTRNAQGRGLIYPFKANYIKALRDPVVLQKTPSYSLVTVAFWLGEGLDQFCREIEQI